jgi:UDP-2,3-diacylglucosamine pyrophosphatase LpxH
LSAIIAFSDVHLGYNRTDYDNFMEFLHWLQQRDDLADVVIIGDLIDLWRRDVVGLEFALSGYMEELRRLQQRVSVHYLFGNHDFHVKFLENHDYEFTAQPSITLNRFGYNIHFLHGHQCDPLQNILGPETSEILCWTMSDNIGEWKSKLWDIFGRPKSIPKDEFEANIDLIMSPPEDKARTDALSKKYAGVADFVECLKAYLRITDEKEFLVYGHTHKPFIDLGRRVANTGCWINGTSPSNTYFELVKWPPQVIEFKGKALNSTAVSALHF